MKKFSFSLTAAALALTGVMTPALPGFGSGAIAQQAGTARTIIIAVGRGQQITLARPVTDVFVANPAVADVDVRSGKLLYVFGRGSGETSVYATDAAGKTVWSATVRVGNNIDSIDQMLTIAMPDAKVRTTTLNGIVLLTGTVASPDDGAEAERLVSAFVGEGVKVVSRIRTATPLQVMLKVRIAEVSRSLAKEISSNLATRDNTNGFQFGLARGRAAGTIGDFNTAALPKLDASSLYGLPAGTLSLPFDPKTGQFVTSGTQYQFNNIAGTNTIALAGKLFGLDVLAAFDAAERAGLVSTLAQPTLTTVSGETAEFLAGGEFPIPISNGLGSSSVEFRNYGVSLSYTPTVLADGRISLRVRPEVSDITSQGSVRIGGLEIPGIITRRAETTVELGSGQSFMIAGLLSNNAQSSVEKIPGAGDIPILGNLFKSNGWKKNETELMIVVTPYLVKPVSDSEIVLPTDGYENPSDLQRLLLGQQSDGKNGGKRPLPTVAPSPTGGPEVGSLGGQPMLPTQPAPEQQAKVDGKRGKAVASVAPGFGN